MSRMLQNLQVQEEESEINMTPMLDVVFIMLIFFIVTASFVKEAGIDVNRPDAPTVAIIDPPGPPIATCVVLAATMALYLPWEAAVVIAFGGGLGYCSYELVHFATHKCRMENRLAAFWMRHHLFHHYRNETVNFGVTTPIWDLVFGTYFRPGQAKRAPA